MKNVPSSRVHDRITLALASLERIYRERAVSGDPHLGKVLEDRIVWRELFDLELQGLDEQIEQICESARSLSAGLPRLSVPTATKPPKPHSP